MNLRVVMTHFGLGVLEYNTTTCCIKWRTIFSLFIEMYIQITTETCVLIRHCMCNMLIYIMYVHFSSVQKFISEDKLPHLLFYGPPGTGKTSTILACAKQLYKDKEFNSMVLEVRNILNNRQMYWTFYLLYLFFTGLNRYQLYINRHALYC